MEVVTLNPDIKKDQTANETLALFAKATEDVSVAAKRMSGFIVIAFDEDGTPKASAFLSHLFPMPTPMLPVTAYEVARSFVYNWG